MIARANDAQLRDLVFWSLGSLGGATWPLVAVTAPFFARRPRSRAAGARLDLLSSASARRATSASTSSGRASCWSRLALAVGASVAASGVIAFVGLVVPHLVRLAPRARPPHAASRLLPRRRRAARARRLGARTLVAPAELPVGVVTSPLGGPFFLWLLWRTRRAHGRLGMSRPRSAASPSAIGRHQDARRRFDSRSRRASSSRSSARTAPASRRCSSCSRASSTPTAATVVLRGEAARTAPPRESRSSGEP